MPLQLVRQDITKMKCDAIVAPTNEALLPDGGTDAMIHAAAGAELLDACRSIGHLGVGEAAIARGFALPSKHVIFTVGPQWQGGTCGEREALERCYRSVLSLSVKHRCRSVAIPLISSGAFGYPKDQVLKVALGAIGEFLFTHELLVYLVVYDKESYQFSTRLLCEVTEFIDDQYTLSHDAPEDAFYALHGDEIELSASRKRRRMPRKDASPAEANAAPAEQMHTCREITDGLEEMLRGVKGRSFALTLFRLIDEKGMSDVECYKRANVDKKTFSKIKCNEKYKPSKQTVVAFAIALELSFDQTQELLATVGLTLSKSSVFDIIIEFFIRRGRYDIMEINETLFEFDQVLLGST